MKKFNWEKKDGRWFCKMPNDITLCVSPTKYARHFLPKAARGAKWTAQASIWDEKTSTLSRYGRDEYGNNQESADKAKRLAESIYLEAKGA